MRLLRLIVSPRFGAITGVLSALTLIIAFAVYTLTSPTTTDPGNSRTPGVMYPVIVEPLGPNWTAPSPTR